MEKPIWNRRGVLAWTAPPQPSTPHVVVSDALKHGSAGCMWFNTFVKSKYIEPLKRSLSLTFFVMPRSKFQKGRPRKMPPPPICPSRPRIGLRRGRSEEHTSELQSQSNLVCRLLLEKKKHNVMTTVDHM